MTLAKDKRTAIAVSQDAIYGLVPKINIALVGLAIFLTVSLSYSVTRTYDPVVLKTKPDRIKPLELMEAGMTAEKLPVYQEDILKKKSLFNQSVTKKPELEKRAFVLLGVSLGKKNIAVIKDNVAGKTYYCSEGDMAGDFKVKEITKEKVILESETGLLEINR